MPLTDVYCPICYKTEFINVKSLDNFDHRSLHGDRSAIFNYDSDEDNYRQHVRNHQHQHHAHPKQQHMHRYSMYEQEINMNKREARIKSWIQQSKQHTFARIKILNNFEMKQPKQPPVYNFVKIPVRPPAVKRRQSLRENVPKAITQDEDDYQHRSPSLPSVVTPSTAEYWTTKHETSYLSPVQEIQKSRESMRKLPLPSQSPGLPANFFNNSQNADKLNSSSVDNLTPRKKRGPSLFRSTSFIQEKKPKSPVPAETDFKVKTPERRAQSRNREKSPMFFSYDEVLERLKTPVTKKVSEQVRSKTPPPPPPVKARTDKNPSSPVQTVKKVERRRVERKQRSPSPPPVEAPKREVKPKKKQEKALSPVSPVVERRQPKPRKRRSPEIKDRTPSPKSEPERREKPQPRKPRKSFKVQRTPTPSPEPEKRQSKPKQRSVEKRRSPTPELEPEPEKRQSKPKQRSVEKRRSPTPEPEPEPEPEKKQRKPRRRKTPTPSPSPEPEKIQSKSNQPSVEKRRSPTPPPSHQEPEQESTKPKTPAPSLEPEKEEPKPKKEKTRRRSPTPSPQPEKRQRKPRRKRTPTPSPSPEPERRERRHRIKKREKTPTPTPPSESPEPEPEPKPRREKARKKERQRERTPEASSPEMLLPELPPDSRSLKKEKRRSEPELIQLPDIVKPNEENEEEDVPPVDFQISKSLRTKIRSARINANEKDIQTDAYELIPRFEPYLTRREQSTIGTSPIDNITPITPVLKQNTLTSIALSPILQREETMNEITSTPVVKKVLNKNSSTSPMDEQQSFLDNLSPINENADRTEKEMQTEVHLKQDMGTEPMVLDFHTTGTEPMVLDIIEQEPEPEPEPIDNTDAESEVNSDQSGSTISRRRNSRRRSRRRQRKIYKQIQYHHHYYKSPRDESVEKKVKKAAVADTACSPLPIEKNDDIVISLAKEGHTNIIEVTQKNVDKLKKKGKEDQSYVLPQQAAFIYDDDAKSDTSSSSRPVTSHSQKRPQVYPTPAIVVERKTTTADEKDDDSIVFKLEDLPKDDEYLDEKRYVQESKVLHEMLQDDNNLLRRPLSTIEEDEVDDDENRTKNNPTRVKVVKLKDLQSSLNQIREDDEIVESSLPSNRSSSKHVTFDNDYEVKTSNLYKKKRSNLLPREKEISSIEKSQLFVQDNFSNRYIGKKIPSKGLRPIDQDEYPIDEQNDDLISNPTIRITSAKSIASKSESAFSEPASRFNVRFKNRPNVFKKTVEKVEREIIYDNREPGSRVSYVELNDTRVPRSAPENKTEADDDVQLVQRLLEETDLLNTIQEPQQQQQQQYMYQMYPSSAPPQMQYQVDQNGAVYATAPEQYYYYHPQSALPYSNIPAQQQYYYIEQPYMQQQYMTTPLPEEQTITLQKSPGPERRNTASSPIKAFERVKKPIVKKPEGPSFIISNNSNKPVFIKDNKQPVYKK